MIPTPYQEPPVGMVRFGNIVFDASRVEAMEEFKGSNPQRRHTKIQLYSGADVQIPEPMNDVLAAMKAALAVARKMD